MRHYVFYFIALSFPFIASKARISLSIEVVATIGAHAITNYDVEETLRIQSFLSELKYDDLNTAENRKEILKKLIDDHYKDFFFKNIKLEVPQELVEKNLSDIQKKHGVKPDQFAAYLSKRRISLDAFKRFVKRQILWEIYLHERYGALIKVSASQVAAAKKEIYQNFQGPFYQVYEIVVSSKKEAENILDKLQKGIAFRDLVHSYSQAPSKAQEGVVSARPLHVFEKSMQEILKKTKPQTLFGPLCLGRSRWIVGIMEVFYPTPQQLGLPTEAQIKQSLEEKALEGFGKDDLKPIEHLMPCHIK